MEVEYMEYKNTWLLSVVLGILLLWGIYLILPFGKQVKFKKGNKANVPEFLVKSGLYKRRLLLYRILRVLSVVSLGACLVFCALLVSRPYETDVTEEPLYGRDIFLCMDVSGSVNALNAKIVDELKTVVDASEQDRFGIIIFNTSPVVLCPLTMDHEYVKQTLTRLKECVDVFLDDNALEHMGRTKYFKNLEYITGGTLVDSDNRGSSLVGDGLAYCAVAFPDMEKDPNRVRLVIFSTDNEVDGTPLCSLDEAAQLCRKKKIKVFGIGTSNIYSVKRNEMESAITGAGGKFYLEEDSLKGIIQDIDKEGQSLLMTTTNVTEQEKPETAMIALLICAGLFFVFTRLSRR